MLKSASTPGSEYRELFNRWAEANGYPFRMGEPIGHKRRDWNPDEAPDNIKEIKVLGHEAVIRGESADHAWVDETKYFTNKTLWRYFMEESNERTQVNVNPDGDVLEIVHRHGAAAEIQEPRKVQIDGSIEAPLEYYQKRKEVIDQDAAHLEVNEHAGSIKLYCNPHSPVGTVVQGSIKMNPLLQMMRINDFSGNTFVESDFIMLLKQTRSIFQDQSESLNLVDKIKNLEMRVEKEIDRKDDERGSRKDIFEQVCETDLPDGFTLQTNIFVASKEGTKEEVFFVELKFHYKSQLHFWLESPAFQELYDDRVEAMMGEQINGFSEEIPIIYL